MDKMKCPKCKNEMRRDDAARPEKGPTYATYWICDCGYGKFSLKGLPKLYEG